MNGFKEEAYLLDLRERGHEFVDWYADRVTALFHGKIPESPDVILELLNTCYRITIEEIKEEEEESL